MTIFNVTMRSRNYNINIVTSLFQDILSFNYAKSLDQFIEKNTPVASGSFSTVLFNICFVSLLALTRDEWCLMPVAVMKDAELRIVLQFENINLQF